MVDAGIHWTLPKEYFIKINVHSFYLDDPLLNGNRSGIGIVFRNDRGTLVRMIAGSLRIQGRRLNELYAMQYALRRAFFENYNLLELETDHGEAYWEWMRSNEEGVRPEHQSVVRQLNARQDDKNLALDVTVINEESNLLAAYLAEYGAHHWTSMIIIKGIFGRVQELWFNDMGLGPVDPQFQAIHEEDLVETDNDGDIVNAGFEANIAVVLEPVVDQEMV
ncbi:hypothetical protein POM88_016266 [Heracleum sosnowskyi]|uniref:RNase H type-1 domain-containing protein n=1 Tax=Heracleum sosnowskyi TaxID=360622 RepID=A0AAD8IMZ5_9APIA|nr:hypothetical protein POM88_016266 [Heracleum sosnowskyi]